MKLFLEKSKCKFSESINGFVVEVETIGPIEFTGGDGGDYLLFDENEEGIGPAPWEPFVVEKPKTNWCMTNAEKQLLIKDLCARFPYGVICRLSVKGADVSITEELKIGGLEHFINGTMNVKPYLRPMSSMTEEEKKDYHNYRYWIEKGDIEHCTINMMDWLNEHHFDFRNLIEKGLAIDCTGLNIY